MKLHPGKALKIAPKLHQAHKWSICGTTPILNMCNIQVGLETVYVDRRNIQAWEKKSSIWGDSVHNYLLYAQNWHKFNFISKYVDIHQNQNNLPSILTSSIFKATQIFKMSHNFGLTCLILSTSDLLFQIEKNYHYEISNLGDHFSFSEWIHNLTSSVLNLATSFQSHTK